MNSNPVHGVAKAPQLAYIEELRYEKDYQEYWGRVKLLELRRKIAGLEIERDRLLAQQGQLREYKAAYAVAQRALQESREPRLRLLKILRQPASEALIEALVADGDLPLVAPGVSLDTLEIAVALSRLGMLTLRDGIFSLTKDGRELIRKLGEGEDDASPASTAVS